MDAIEATSGAKGSVPCFECSIFFHFAGASALLKVAVSLAIYTILAGNTVALPSLKCAPQRTEKLTSQPKNTIKNKQPEGKRVCDLLHR